MSLQPFFRVLQAFVRWVLAIGWTAMTVLATATLFFGNFVVAWQAFVLLGFEPIPLLSLPLLGPMATAIGVGDADLASLYAAVLTAAMAVTVVGAFKLGHEALTLFFDLRQARLAGNQDEGPALIKFSETVAGFAIALSLAILVMRYDVGLFNVRLQALLTGLEAIQDSIKWVPSDLSRLGGFLADFAARARLGYLAIIAGAAFITEKSFQRASERWLVLGQTVDAAIVGTPASNPVAVGAPERNPNPAGPSVIDTQSGTPNKQAPADVPDAGPASHRDQWPRPAPPAGPAAPPPPRPAELASTPPPPSGPTVRVVWGPGEVRQMSLAELERNPDNYVRDGSGRAWFRRGYYDEINGALHKPDEQAQQTQEEASHV